MITLVELINATVWTAPQEHVRVTLWDKSKIYDKGEFTDIKLDVKTLAQYGNYVVSDIDIEVEHDENGNENNVLSCLIYKE